LAEVKYVDIGDPVIYKRIFNYIFFVYQGLILDLLFIGAYMNVYIRFRRFHMQAIERFKSVYN
jgi:hypothetical protein